LRFAGQYYDQETGLHYNWHRYYDPSTGRYLTPDPIGLAGGINLYFYAANNPINAIDPFGLTTWYYDETMGSLGAKWGNPRPDSGEIFAPKPTLRGGLSDSLSTRMHKFRNPSAWGPGQGAQNFMDLVDLGLMAYRARQACPSGFDDDVLAIARHNNLKPARLQRIKEYLFGKKWDFQDPQALAAWRRLSQGRGTGADMVLLKHETAEMYLRSKGYSQFDAHNRVNDRYGWEYSVH